MKLLTGQQQLTRRKHSQTARVATSPQRLAFFVLGPRIILLFFCPREQLCIPVRILSCPQFPRHPLLSSQAPSSRQETPCPTSEQQHRLRGPGGALWSSLIPLFNKLLDIIYRVDWVIDPRQVVEVYNRSPSTLASPQSTVAESASSDQRRLQRAEQQSHLPRPCKGPGSQKQCS